MTDLTDPNNHPEPDSSTRRDVLKQAALAAGLAVSGVPAAAQEVAQAPALPEAHWRDRMQASDDGKRYGWLVDVRRCFGCHACEVACKAENDVPLGQFIRQTIYHDFERPGGQVARIMLPMSCLHCEDAPCIKACPCGALHKGSGGSVQVDYDACSGHAACKEACPYGAIYIDPVANQAVKCHNCTHRVDAGMEPACVATCPAEALIFGDLNDPDAHISQMAQRLESEARLEVLRPEKRAKPRVRFVTDSARPLSVVEPKVPREGQSYGPEAYDVFNWQEPEEQE